MLRDWHWESSGRIDHWEDSGIYYLFQLHGARNFSFKYFFWGFHWFFFHIPTVNILHLATFLKCISALTFKCINTFTFLKCINTLLLDSLIILTSVHESSTAPGMDSSEGGVYPLRVIQRLKYVCLSTCLSLFSRFIFFSLCSYDCPALSLIHKTKSILTTHLSTPCTTRYYQPPPVMSAPVIRRIVIPFSNYSKTSITIIKQQIFFLSNIWCRTPIVSLEKSINATRLITWLDI